ncbi:MAG: hypothetical protein ACYC9P_11600 [Rudaea sp.]
MFDPAAQGPSMPVPEKHNGVLCVAAVEMFAMVRLPFASIANSDALAALLTTNPPPAGSVTVTF